MARKGGGTAECPESRGRITEGCDDPSDAQGALGLCGFVVGLLLPPVGWNGDQELPQVSSISLFSQLVLWGHQEVMGWGAPSPRAGVVGGIFCQVGTALAAGAYPCLSHWRWGN